VDATDDIAEFLSTRRAKIINLTVYTADSGSASQHALDLIVELDGHAQRGRTRRRQSPDGHPLTNDPAPKNDSEPAHAPAPDRSNLVEHRQLGRTGVSVSKLCLGAMMFGAWGNIDHDDSIRIIHRALDAGVNSFDTADVYSSGESEEIVGQALAGGRRDDVVLATKVWGPMGEDANRRGTSRRWIVQAVESSLRRLNSDWIDLYQIHRYEPDTAVEETLGALTDLVHQGKVAFVANHPAVTAPIIGPRTMEHLESQLPAADIVLDPAVLDRIDEIVPPRRQPRRRRLRQPGAGGARAAPA
jgi:diketogulonate reductase-like aldo/keto reductase